MPTRDVASRGRARRPRVRDPVESVGLPRLGFPWRARSERPRLELFDENLIGHKFGFRFNRNARAHLSFAKPRFYAMRRISPLLPCLARRCFQLEFRSEVVAEVVDLLYKRMEGREVVVLAAL